jgi:hypothetical protein
MYNVHIGTEIPQSVNCQHYIQCFHPEKPKPVNCQYYLQCIRTDNVRTTLIDLTYRTQCIDPFSTAFLL